MVYFAHMSDTSNMTIATMPAVSEIPTWLSAPICNEVAPLSPQEMRELTEHTYSNFFEHVLDKVASGTPLASIVHLDARGFEAERIRAWIRRDPERKARFEEAQVIGAGAIEDDLIRIADAEGSLEDVQRSTLRINTRWKMLAVWDRKRYGESKHLEVTTNKQPAVDTLEVLAERLQRLRSPSADVMDVATKTVEGE